MNRSLNQVVDELRVWAAAHVQVNDMAYGSLVDIYNTNQITHCLLAVNCSNATQGENYVELTLELAVFDVVIPTTVDEQNRAQHEVESDTLQIINDLQQTIGNADRWKHWSEIQGVGTAQKFVDRGQDSVTGWLLNMTLRVWTVQGLCDLPLIDYDYGGEYSPVCAPVRIFEDGGLVATIPSGGTYSYQCLPANWELVNSVETQLDSGSIPSGEVGEIAAPDATVRLRVGGMVVAAEDIPSGAVTNLEIDQYCPECLPVEIIVGGTNTRDYDCGTTATVEFEDEEGVPVVPVDVSREKNTVTVVLPCK